MDNCSIHKGAEIKALLDQAGARLIYGPRYSPDFSSIENCWSKIKRVLRSIGARTYPDLAQAIQSAFEQVWQRRSYYLYGVAEPKTGETFFYQFSYLDTDCFAEFLKLFSLFLSSSLHILQLDNDSFHTTQKLSIPENIVLLFQPAHCPERWSD